MAPDEIKKLMDEARTWAQGNNLWFQYVYIKAVKDNSPVINTGYRGASETDTWRMDFLVMMGNINTDPRAKEMLEGFLLWKLTR